MGRLSTALRDDFAALKRLCTRGLGSEELRVAIGDRLSETLRLDAYCAVELDPISAIPTHAVHRGWPKETPEILARHVLFASPTGDIPKIVQGGDRAFVTETIVEDVGTDPYHQHVLFHAGLRHEAEVVCTRRGRAAAMFYLARKMEQGTFSAAELRFLASLAPHITAAMHAARARESMLGSGGIGFVVLDEEGRVELADREGEKWLSATGGEETSFVLGALQALTRRDDQVPELFARDRKTNVVHHVRGERRVGSDGRERTVCIITPARVEQASALSIFGLSDRECAVASRVLRGDANDEIAGELQCSVHTIREHLKNVFDKLGVGSRREMALRLMSAEPPPAAGMVQGRRGS